MENKYALLIDIKSSRSLDEGLRFDAQEKLSFIISELNRVFSHRLLFPVDFSSGDSVQGIFGDSSSPLEFYYMLITLFFPYEVRAGIGVGGINDMIYEASKDSMGTNYMDGRAYHLARNALDISKGGICPITILSDDYWDDCIVNKLFAEASNLRGRLSSSQLNLLNLCNVLNPLLGEAEQGMFEIIFDKCVSYLNIDGRITDKYMYRDKLYKELRMIYDLSKSQPFEDALKTIKKHIPSFDIMPRKSDAYLAKLYGVSPQNIWLLKKRGNMDEIRTAELLAVMYLRRNYHD